MNNNDNNGCSEITRESGIVLLEGRVVNQEEIDFWQEVNASFSEEVKEDETIDEFHKHEVLDRAYLMVEMWETAIMKHVLVRNNAEFREKAEKVQELILAFYQFTGMK